MSGSVPPPGWAPTAAPDQQAQHLPRAPRTRAPRTRPRLLIAGGAAALIAAGALLLLGSSSTPLTDPVAKAATISSTTPGYRSRMSLEVTSSAFASPLTGRASGVVDLRDHAMAMSLDLNMNDPRLIQVLGSGTLHVEMIVDGAVVYAKLPDAVIRGLPGVVDGRAWIKLDASKVAQLSALSMLRSDPLTTDPSSFLEYLRATSDSVVAEGSDRVDGVPTTHYRADLMLDRVPGVLPSSLRAQAQKAMSELEQATHLSAVPVDVWIDAHDLIRRSVVVIAFTLGSGVSIRESLVDDIGDYGPQLPPVAPRANDVTDLTHLVPGAG